MNFETNRIKSEWDNKQLNSTLKFIVQDAYSYALDRWHWMFHVTSIYRSKSEDDELEGSGIHTAWRGLDVRTRDVDPDAVNDVADYVNSKWQYDPKRPQLVCCYTRPHGSAIHAHFQAHANTKRRA